jgi:hypothetical protein
LKRLDQENVKQRETNAEILRGKARNQDLFAQIKKQNQRTNKELKAKH